MAVVFISPKKRQQTFFMIITAMFLLILVSISLGVILSKPKEVSQTVVFNKSKVEVNMGIFDLDQFKNLQPFTKMESQYSYIATTKANIVKSGFITAPSIDKAGEILKGMGLSVSTIKEVEIGRDNPFSPYYQVVAVPVLGGTVTTVNNKNTVTQSKVSATK